jgi:hypothetical protein
VRRGLVAVLLLLAVVPARADDEPASRPRTEVGVFPGVNYNSDLGLGMGAVVGIARLAPG